MAAAEPSRSRVRPFAGSTTLGVVPSMAIVASTGARSTWAAMVSIWAASAVSSPVMTGSTSRSPNRRDQPGPGVQRLVVGGVHRAGDVQGDPGRRGGERRRHVVGDHGVVGRYAGGELLLQSAGGRGGGEPADVDAGDDGRARDVAGGDQQVDPVGGGEDGDGAGGDQHRPAAPPRPARTVGGWLVPGRRGAGGAVVVPAVVVGRNGAERCGLVVLGRDGDGRVVGRDRAEHRGLVVLGRDRDGRVVGRGAVERLGAPVVVRLDLGRVGRGIAVRSAEQPVACHRSGVVGGVHRHARPAVGCGAVAPHPDGLVRQRVVRHRVVGEGGVLRHGGVLR